MLTHVVTAMALAFGLVATPAMANPAGPHLDGNAYDALRPAAPVPTLKFAMDVECLDPGGQDFVLDSLEFGVEPWRGGMRAPGLAGRSLVTLGPDFVISRGPYGTVVHDFRFRRLLTIGNDEKQFLNHSLYGHLLVRWRFLSNNLYPLMLIAKTGGSIQRPLSVARFLVEHGNGITDPPATSLKELPAATPNTERQGTTLASKVGTAEVLKAKLGTMEFPSAVHQRSFAAWITWFFRVHPSLARLLADDAGPPSSLQFIRSDASTAMGSSEPPVCSVDLNGFSQESGRLDVVAGLASKLPAWPPLLPGSLTRLMIDAARLQAPNGPTGNAEYSQRMRKLAVERHYLDAALLSLHANASTGACTAAQHDSILCDAMTDVFRTAMSDGSVQTLRKALSLSSQDKHGQAVEMLIPLRGRSSDRPDILEFMIANELVEARRRSQLNEALGKEFDRLTSTFRTALARDPYSPARYRDMANYLGVAARSLKQRYFVRVFQTVILDLGRALPGGPLSPLLRDVIAGERKADEDFPVLFPKVGDRPE